MNSLYYSPILPKISLKYSIIFQHIKIPILVWSLNTNEIVIQQKIQGITNCELNSGNLKQLNVGAYIKTIQEVNKAKTIIIKESTFRQEKSGHIVGHDHHHIIKNRWIKVLILDHTQAGSTTSKLPLYMYIIHILDNTLVCVTSHNINSNRIS